MCEYISWKAIGKDVFFLQDEDLKGKTFDDYKKFNANWKQDIYGHGAIEYFYPELKGKGIHRQCTDFSTPDNFPDEIVQAIKDCKMTKFGVQPEGLLNGIAQVECDTACNIAWTEYVKTCHVALARPKWIEYCKAFNVIFWSLFRFAENRNPLWK